MGQPGSGLSRGFAVTAVSIGTSGAAGTNARFTHAGGVTIAEGGAGGACDESRNSIIIEDGKVTVTFKHAPNSFRAAELIQKTLREHGLF